MSEEFPGNSKSVRQPKPTPETEKKIESVLSSMAAKKKKSLFKRFTDVIIGGDSKTVVHYVFAEVIIPQVKDLLAEATSSGIEKMIYGESRPRGARYGGRPAGPTNYTKYSVRGTNPIGSATRDPRDRPPNPTSLPKQLDYEEILLQTRLEAETVLERLFDLIGEYESASIHDIKNLVGWSPSYTDQKWGWTDLQGSSVRRVREGYMLELPRPVALD
jgi:hypothetical protein